MNQAKKLVSAVQDPKTKATLIGLGFLTLLVLGWFSFGWYKAYTGKKAQQILGECLLEYQKAVDSVQPLWSEVNLMNELGYDQASGTALQPFFLVMQAQASARQHKTEEAVAQMQQAIDALSADSPYKNYFALTQSLMQLDAEQKEGRQKGFEQLQVLAQDADNQYGDAAQFHVGSYYFADNNFAQAKKVWQALVEQKGAWKDSPWLALAEQKLATL